MVYHYFKPETVRSNVRFRLLLGWLMVVAFALSGQTPDAGSPVSAGFTLSMAAGPAPFTVQFADASSTNVTAWDWNFGDGSPDSQMENPAHTFTAAGSFNVVLTVSDGLGDTDEAGLTIQALAVPPPNDSFSNRIMLTGATHSTIGSNVGAALEPGEPVDAGKPGGESVWWSWIAPGPGWVTISTAGSGFDTTLGVYTGRSVTNLSLVAANDDAAPPEILTSQVSFYTQGLTTYQISVDGNDADTTLGSNGVIYLSVTLTPLPSAPAWSAMDISTNTVYSTNFAGRVLLLDFWAPDCQNCVYYESPILNDLQQTLGRDGLSIVGAAQGDEGDVQNDVAADSFNYQIVLSNPSLENSFQSGGITALPTIFLIGRENQLSPATFYGPTDEATLRQAILPLLYENLQLSVCATNSGQTTLFWPTVHAGCVLETTTDPLLGNWSTNNVSITTGPVTTTAYYPNGTTGSRFFRLRIQ